MINVFMWLMFRYCLFFCVVDVLMRLMFEIPQRISLANTDVWGPSGKKYIKTSWSLSVFSQAWSMLWCGWCFSIIYFLVWLMFWSGSCLRSLQHDRCFDMVDVSVLTIFFGVVDVSKQLIFEVPQWISLANTSDISMPSKAKLGWCLRHLREWKICIELLYRNVYIWNF